MRIRLLIALLSIWPGAFAQSHDSLATVQDCEKLALKTITELTSLFNQNQIDSFDSVTNDLIKHCGISECTQRLVILRNIIDSKPTSASIQLYFENNFHYMYLNRMHASKMINFGYRYSAAKEYYGYIPLRHAIDSVVIKAALNLLESKSLDPDEKLICILFSDNPEGFENEMKKQEYDSSYIKQLLNQREREYSNIWGAYTIYAGMFRPLGSNDVFTLSPMIGVSFSSPLYYKVVAEFSFKFRFNINDRNFYYYAMGDTNYVNSAYSIFTGILVGYKIFESRKLIIIPKFGLGLEYVDTGLAKRNKNETDVKYDLSTVHLSVGLSVMQPVFSNCYFGLAINYHYCPYQTDKDLLSEISNNLISTEVFFRF